MNRKNDFSRFDRVKTTLKNGTSFDGILRFSEPLKICGRFTGEIESEGIVFIDSGAEIKADIKAGTVVVNGSVEGNITAKDKIEILPEGCVKGNLKAARLKMADGMKFEGQCRMVRSPESIDIFSAGVDKLKEIVRSV